METTLVNDAAVQTVGFPLQALLVHLAHLATNSMEATLVNDVLYAAAVQTLWFPPQVVSSSDGTIRGCRSKEPMCADGCSAMVLSISFFFLC